MDYEMDSRGPNSCSHPEAAQTLSHTAGHSSQNELCDLRHVTSLKTRMTAALTSQGAVRTKWELVHRKP